MEFVQADRGFGIEAVVGIAQFGESAVRLARRQQFGQFQVFIVVDVDGGAGSQIRESMPQRIVGSAGETGPLLSVQSEGVLTTRTAKERSSQFCGAAVSASSKLMVVSALKRR